MERVKRARPAVDARDVAGDESITATRIGIAANVVNRLFRKLALAWLELVWLELVWLELVRRFNGAVSMASLGEQSQEMCGSNGAAATRQKRFCDAFP